MCPRLPRASMGHVVRLTQAADVCLPSVYPEQRRVTPLKSTLAEVFILNPLNPFRMNTCRAKPHLAQFWCNVSPFRINTCKSVSKQTTLSAFRINTYEKTGGWGRGIPSNRPILPLPFSVHSSKFRIPQVLYLPLLRKHRGYGGILPILVHRSLSGRSLRTGLGVSSNPSLSTFNRRSRLGRNCRSKIPTRSGPPPMPLFHGSRIAWAAQLLGPGFPATGTAPSRTNPL